MTVWKEKMGCVCVYQGVEGGGGAGGKLGKAEL